MTAARSAQSAAHGNVYAAPRARAGERTDPLRFVQQAAGNAGVTALLGSGRPLDPALRGAMEPALGHDLSGVRIHDDDGGAAFARRHGAAALTAGEDIAFAARRYRPDSSEGRVLIAHELVHVVQQARAGESLAERVSGDDAFELHAAASAPVLAAGGGPIGPFPTGPAPSVQRSPDAEAESARRLDELGARMIRMLYSSPEDTSTDLLLAETQPLRERFADEDRPQTRLAAARALIASARVLRRREATASRDASGALLLEPSLGEGLDRPWSSDRPHSLDQVPGFGADAETGWLVAVQTAEAPRQRGRGRRAPRAPATPPPAVRQAGVAAAAAPSSVAVANVATPRERSVAERSAGETGGASEIATGLAALSGVTVDQTTAAVAAAGHDITSNAVRSGVGSRPMLDLCAELWFVDRHLYVLDRTGHIVSAELEDVAFDLQGTTLTPGAYYFGPFRLASSAGWRETVDTLVKLDSGPQISAGDIFPARVLTSLIPLLERGRAAIGAGNGIGLIISHRTTERSPSFSSDRLVQAVDAGIREFPWALRVRFAEMAEHPVEEVFNVALGLGIGALAEAIPGVGEVLLAYQAMRLAQWMGTAADVAGRARSADEIEIAGQAIAKKVADWAVAEVETRIASGALRAGAGGREEPTSAAGREERVPPRAGTEEPRLEPPAAGGAQHPSGAEQKLLPPPPEQKLLPAPPEQKLLPAPPEQKLLPAPPEQKLLPAPPDPRVAKAQERLTRAQEEAAGAAGRSSKAGDRLTEANAAVTRTEAEVVQARERAAAAAETRDRAQKAYEAAPAGQRNEPRKTATAARNDADAADRELGRAERRAAAARDEQAEADRMAKRRQDIAERRSAKEERATTRLGEVEKMVAEGDVPRLEPGEPFTKEKWRPNFGRSGPEASTARGKPGEIPPGAVVRIFTDPITDPALQTRQSAAMTLAETNPQEAGNRFAQVVGEAEGWGEVSERFREKHGRLGRRWDFGNTKEVTIEGRIGKLGDGKLDQLWFDLNERGRIDLIVPKLSPEAEQQLARLAGEWRKWTGREPLILVRETMP
jgi:hypothetical protein